MNMREKIADALVNVLDHYRSTHDIEYHAADAILAALPDMIAPLVWVDFDKFMTHAGNYKIRKAPYESHWRLFFGQEFINDDQDKDILGLKANTHHRAAIMAAFTGETQ
jgi:hypothetical protein